MRTLLFKTKKGAKSHAALHDSISIFRKSKRIILLLTGILASTGLSFGQNECNLGTNIPNDVKQVIQRGFATNSQQGEGIERTYDGDPNTIYHSSWGGGKFPITIEYIFNNVDRIDYFVYTPRLDDSDNGRFQEIEIYYSTAEAPRVFNKACNFNLNAPHKALSLNFPNAIRNPKNIRIIIRSGMNNFASCAEMAFYKKAENAPPSNVFKDNIGSWIKTGTTQPTINAMPDGFYKNLAQCMFNGTYDTTYRVQKYEPYATLTTLASQLKTNLYSTLENPTGIYLEPGPAIIFVDNDFGQNISMRVYDYSLGSKSIKNNTYPLRSGVNIIQVLNTGLAYINYYSDNYRNLQPIKIHIASGKVNGYFDISKHDNATWRDLLRNQTTSMIDLKGNKIGMLYPKASLLQFSPVNGRELVQFYDEIVKLEQTQMGLYKYNKVPKNHMFAYAYEEPGWFADDNGAHYGGGLNATCSVENMRHNNIWGIAHELGHINQIRPGLYWVSTSEVTNNIYSVWATYQFTIPPYNRKLETEIVNDCLLTAAETGLGHGSGNLMAGGRFNAFLNNGIVKKQQWLCQYGYDALKIDEPEPDWQNGNGDHFVKLCPLWQLMLYYQEVHPEKKDWYGDVAEIVRNTNEANLSNGTLLTNFLKNTCDIVHEDLTEYFQKVGMLRTYNKIMKDYHDAPLVVTAADSAAVVSYIQGKHFPKPESPAIYYLSANSVDAFKRHADVEGTFNVGCSAPEGDGVARSITVNHGDWRNVVVFETYNGSKLTNLSMVGAGYTFDNKTRVYYPAGSTAVYAVGWNGKKTLVYGIASCTPLLNVVSNIMGTSFNLKVETLPQGSNYDISLDGGRTFIKTNVTATPIVIQDLARNQNYKVVTRLNFAGRSSSSDVTNVTTAAQ